MKFTEAILFASICAVLSARLAHGQASNAVAFSAVRTTNFPDVAQDTPVSFNIEEVDIGNDFDADIGYFDVPVSGIYFFSFAVKSSDAIVHLKVNGGTPRRSTAFTDSTTNNGYNMASGTAVMDLSSSDNVQFFLSQFGNGGINSTSPPEAPGIYTSFNGMLLQDSTSSMNAFDVGRYVAEDPGVSIPSAIDFDAEYVDLNSCFSCCISDGGYFLADYTDVYMFSFMGKGNRMSVHLNGRDAYQRSAIRCNNNDLDVENVASNTVILAVNAGEEFQLVQGVWGDNLDNPSTSDGVFTSFNGVKLFDVSLDWCAFSARRTTNMPSDVTDQIIKFDQLDYDKGGAFSTVDGTFVAPRFGYYFFTFTIKSSVAAAHLKHNGMVKRSVITTSPDCAENTVQNSAVLLLAQGDVVALYLSPYGVGLIEDMEPNTGGIFTSFSGTLLFDAQ